MVIDTRYNDQGAVVLVTRPYFLANGSVSTSGSNNAGATRIDPDALGRPLKVYQTDPQGSQAAVSFPVVGPRRAAITSYQRQGQRIAITNDKAQVRTEERDARGLLVRVSDATGAQLARRYDAFGNLLQTTDALQNLVKVQYDLLGRKLTLTDPDLGVWSYCRGHEGQVLQRHIDPPRSA